jgi:membrane protein implicated in regulation of membrane protease activity
MNWEIFQDPVLIWFLIGLAFLLLELIIPGLVIVFFGFGAWITALSMWLFDFGINTQLIIFLVTSVLSLALLRNYLKKRFFKEDKTSPDTLEDEFIGQTATALNSFSPGYTGKVEFKGSGWNAKSTVEIKEGQLVKIINKDSITLIVEPQI